MIKKNIWIIFKRKENKQKNRDDDYDLNMEFLQEKEIYIDVAINEAIDPIDSYNYCDDATYGSDSHEKTDSEIERILTKNFRKYYQINNDEHATQLWYVSPRIGSIDIMNVDADVIITEKKNIYENMHIMDDKTDEITIIYETR